MRFFDMLQISAFASDIVPEWVATYIASWRMSIGLFYGVMYGMVTKSYIGKISLPFSLSFYILEDWSIH